MHTPIAAPLLHTPAQPVHPVAWWWRVVRRRTQPVPHPAILAPMADRPAKRDRITILIALATAAVSAWFSIYGMTAIFVGAFLPIVALGVVLIMIKKSHRVALYLRVSTDGQTTANQEQELRAVAERKGCEIVRVYRDHGISGAK